MKSAIIAMLSFVALSFGTTILAQSDYKMAGPYRVVARDGEFRSSKNGSEQDMKMAYECALAGDKDKALEIIHAYARTLQRIDGHDAPLCTIQGYDLVRAMTLLREYKTEAWDKMLRTVWLAVLDKFEADSPYANGNWGAIVNRMRMAAAIYLEDSALYAAALDYFYHANDNGSLPRYINELGQSQETGRDQAHVQLGLEALAQTCEMAREQGDDLWGALDNRLLKGFEYTAKYNLGYEVPFSTWTDCTGLYNDWTSPGAMSRGKLWDIYQLPYDHYVGRKGLKMPYTAMALEVLAGKRKIKIKDYQKLHQVFTYAAPRGAPLKQDYELYIQPRGSKEWTRIDTYMARVNAPVAEGKHRQSEISYAMFDFSGDVFVRVVCKNKQFKTVKIRPAYRGVIANRQNDSTLQFMLFQPENLSIEFDGDLTNNLLLFTSKPVQSSAEARKEARQQGRDFIYYPPGYYDQADTLYLKSNTTLYLAGGSYFKGTFAIDDAENVSILGRGIARPPRGYEGCHVYRSKNVLIDGLILNTCPVGGSDGVMLHNVKSISHPAWGDGLNVFASSNVTYDRVFCRNSDDCTTAYATRKGFSGSVNNVCMKNSTLWADVAHPIFIGIHGDARQMDSIVNLRYENIDILCQAEPQLDYQGCLAINCGDNNLVHNVIFDNIRIEGVLQGSILQVKVGYNQKYCAAPGRGVENILFRGIRYYGPEPNMSLILGYNEQRLIKNITFEGFKINGRAIYDNMPGKPGWYKTADMGKIYVNDLVENLKFIK
ncbi:MAG: alginate lyase family protein [Bacteroidales bacterium]|nr:alginate lyase family protein [Bacteroidales bacterium]